MTVRPKLQKVWAGYHFTKGSIVTPLTGGRFLQSLTQICTSPVSILDVLLPADTAEPVRNQLLSKIESDRRSSHCGTSVAGISKRLSCVLCCPASMIGGAVKAERRPETFHRDERVRSTGTTGANVFGIARTLACSAYSLICVLPKSHPDKSTSTSPKKPFRPNVSLCHTDIFKFCLLNTSKGILNCGGG